MMLFSNIRHQTKARVQDSRRAERYRELIRREAQIGGQLFGPVPAGGRREFFCLDQYTWVWHEEWMEGGMRKVRTTRYEMRPSGVVKIQDGFMYQSLTEKELRRLFAAIKLYYQRVKTELYSDVSAPAA